MMEPDGEPDSSLKDRIVLRNSRFAVYHARLRLMAAAVTASLSVRNDLPHREACVYTPSTRSSTALIEVIMVLPSSVAEASKAGNDAQCDSLDQSF